MAVSNSQLFDEHVAEWQKFWTDFEIKVSGNRVLVNSIYTAILLVTDHK